MPPCDVDANFVYVAVEMVSILVLMDAALRLTISDHFADPILEFQSLF